MIDSVYATLDALLPFSWASYAFMKNALMAVCLTAPVLGLWGTAVVSNRMAFFSDALGHAALTGVAIGVMAGIGDPLWAMLAFAAISAIGIANVKHSTMASADTVIGAFASAAVAAGIIVLTKAGGFAKWQVYVIGDILSIDPREIAVLAVTAAAATAAWIILAHRILLVGLSPALARSRGVSPRTIETVFMVIVAVVVTVSIRWIGILLINAFLVLPAAAARNISRSMRGYVAASVISACVAGIAGLIVSYYAETATGATVVVLLAAWYVVTAVLRSVVAKYAL